MRDLIHTLTKRYPTLKFKAGQDFYWSPKSNEIIYRAGSRSKTSRWSLLHEVSHALLDHRNYRADIELVKMETEAWEKAKQLASSLNIKISEDHIQNCLDSYRDWLHKRSICPNCNTQSLQQDDFVHYRCFNCNSIWSVSTSRFSRSYRRTKNSSALPVFQ